MTVTNESEYESIKSIIKNKIMILSNGISKEKLEILCDSKSLPSNSIKKINYVGNTGIAQELEILIKLAIIKKNLEITIVGDGAKLESLKNECKLNEIKNIKFMGFVDPTKVNQYLIDVDILFAQIGNKYLTAVPSKVFEYICSGNKILLGLPKNSISRSIFSKFDGVYIYNSGEIDDLLRSLELLKTSELKKSDVDNNIKKLKNSYIREDNVDEFIKKFLNIYDIKNQ